MLNGVALADLYRHMEWADATVWTAVLASPTGRPDKQLLDYFYHLHMVQFAFLRVWRGESRTAAFPEFDEAQPLMNWGQTYYPAAFAHLGTLDEVALAQPMPVPWAAMVEERLGRKPETTTVGETVLQVTLHTLYHRGQINARLRELDGNPPLVDFIVWIWLGRPAAVWPLSQ
jgi:uncharacterized damage-inducible protein DinB